jgi:hypothetical protein
MTDKDSRFIDLHTHTTFSDGTLTPTQLVEYASEKGLSAVAITDHDCTDGLREAKLCGEKVGVEVIPGIEISAEYENDELHIVGLFIDGDNAELNSILKELRDKRTARNKLVVEKFNELGIPLTYEEVEKTAEGAIITRAHFAKALLKNGYVTSVKEAFDRYIGDNKPAYIRRELPVWKDAIKFIRNAGGVAVLAHPLLYKLGQRRLETIIRDLALAGLTGIEAYYSTHTPSDVKYIKMIAQKYRLKLSGGSDYHGDNKPLLDLGTGYGNLVVPYEVLTELKGVIKNG